PCGRPLHAALDAAIEIREALGIARPEDVADVEITLDGAIYRDQFEVGPHRARPRQIVEAQFGLPFLVALALIHGKVAIADVAHLDGPDELGLAARIKGHAASEPRPRDWACIAVRHADGRTHARETTIPLGAPERPLSAEQRASKFRDCALNAKGALSSETIEGLLAELAALEHLPDIGKMLERR
ncbi:MAG: MmgE/PrpD family protein, partial [Alphaproteobacteria bacterium]|nr:MmgE/PrpD family protein [Alphaproteobacteria bacterium]